MKKQWRFSEEECHVFFVAFDENAERPGVETRFSKKQISIWLETLKDERRWRVLPSGQDIEFFPFLVETELVRLASFDINQRLPCGCDVFVHRKVLQQFRLKNLEPS